LKAAGGDRPVLADMRPLMPEVWSEMTRGPSGDRYAQHTCPSTPAAGQQDPTDSRNPNERIWRRKAEVSRRQIGRSFAPQNAEPSLSHEAIDRLSLRVVLNIWNVRDSESSFQTRVRCGNAV
jgi:hypothetical protein